MGWYAVEELENAWEETKQLLLPFDLGTWARLSLIVLLTGGFNTPNLPSSPSGNINSNQGDYSDIYGTSGTADTHFEGASSLMPELGMTGLATSSATADSALAGLVLLAAVFGLAFIFISSVFEFIYYQSLLDKDVSIRKNWSKHWRKGARYFGFRLGVLLFVGIVVLGVVAGFMADVVAGGLMLFAAIAGLIPLMVFLELTRNFVLLKMMEEDLGVIDAWRDFWPELRAEWKQVAVYLVLRLAITVAAVTLVFIGGMIVALILLIPGIIVGALLYMIAPVLVTIPIILGGLVWIALLLGLVVVPKTYLYNYAILVYEDLTG